jgi:hypothetical protein
MIASQAVRNQWLFYTTTKDAAIASIAFYPVHGAFVRVKVWVQVATEFIVTGTFLLVTVASWILDTNGATAHLVLLPTPPVAIEPGCAVCVCDLDGVIAGVNIGMDGGCIIDRRLSSSHVPTPLTSPMPLCGVPKECSEASVHNVTEALQASMRGYTLSF